MRLPRLLGLAVFGAVVASVGCSSESPGGKTVAVTDAAPLSDDAGVDAGLDASDAAGDAGLTCAEQVTETTNAIATAGSNLLASQANLNCTVDSDCAIATPSSPCWGGCGGPIVNAVGAAQLAAVIESIDAKTCATFVADGCPPPALPPCPPLAGKVGCVSGTCAVYLPSEDAGADGGTVGSGDASDAGSEEGG